ncbi:Uncharacterised protein [Yersinia massiliensis]|nr:Uncharacterised protein [Yersinia massiliensis]
MISLVLAKLASLTNIDSGKGFFLGSVILNGD